MDKKKIIADIIDIVGYGFTMNMAFRIGQALYGVYKHGSATIVHSGGKPSLMLEIGLVAGTGVFALYKVYKNIADRHK